ncbi:zf-TFIIB domain-containing protein [Kribbella sp. NPDC051770]|uniref:TFIIB-type zinc ribbon-containing protein n=1 Tax=Kribbella sp. NPDC051770 TaxID=3155413 RepID=UPI003417309D
MESLICPKCRGAMRTYERSNVTVDQCTECRGIFLDRGELEKLVDAEVAYNGPQQQRAPEPRYEEKRYEEKRYDDRRYDNDRRYDDRNKYGQQYPQRKKKKSFFDELFD